MPDRRSQHEPLFRVWIATYPAAEWRPVAWNDMPPAATAVQAVDDGLYSASEAALFLEGFNGSMLTHHEPLWAVAVPVRLRYDGDPLPGMPISGFAFEEPAGSLAE